MQPLAQLAEQMLTPAQFLKSVSAKGSGKGREGAHRVRGEIRGGCLKISGHETGEGFVAAHQIAKAPLHLKPASLLQGGEPRFQGPRQGVQGGGSRPGRIERMSCSHSASASCAWIRR